MLYEFMIVYNHFILLSKTLCTAIIYINSLSYTTLHINIEIDTWIRYAVLE